MAEPRKLDPLEVESVQLARCDACDRLHLVGYRAGVARFVAVLDADDWAELFLLDSGFAEAVAKRLGRH